MTQQARLICESDIYHITARGVGRQIIFEDDGDRRALLDSLKTLKKDCGVEILAWCLMDNHMHLLLHGAMEGISNMMRRLLGGYAMRFNLKHDRVGHLFQGRFHSRPVDSDEQFCATLRYIHLNPQELGGDYRSYPWSSYGEYARGTAVLSDTSLVLEMLGSRESFIELHDETASADLVARSARIGREGRPRLSAGNAAALAKDILGQLSPYELKSLGKKERDSYLGKLRNAGLSVRQIERLTGIGRSIISRVDI